MSSQSERVIAQISNSRIDPPPCPECQDRGCPVCEDGFEPEEHDDPRQDCDYQYERMIEREMERRPSEPEPDIEW